MYVKKESALSGIRNVTDHDFMFYRRTFKVKPLNLISPKVIPYSVYLSFSIPSHSLSLTLSGSLSLPLVVMTSR